MLIKAATHLRPILRLGVIQNPSIPTTSTLSPNAFTSNATLTHLQSAAAPHALSTVTPQHPGSGSSSGSWNAGSGSSNAGGKFGSGSGYAGYARAFVNGSSSSGSGGLISQLQNHQDERVVRRVRPTAAGEGERVKVLKDGRPLLRVVDVDAGERKRLQVFPSQVEQRVTIVDVSEAMNVQSLAMLTARRAAQVDTDDVISIDGDDEPVPRSHRLNTRRAVRMNDRSTSALWTVGIRAGQGINVPVTSAQPIRHLTTTSRTHIGSSADDTTLPRKSTTPIRRNSTASVVRPPSSTPVPRSQETELTDAERAMRSELDARDRAAAQRITEALNRGAYEETMRLIAAYRTQDVSPDGEPPYYTSRGYNVILSALQAFRQPGQPISNILTTYNEMLERDLLPTIGTYSIVIQALLERDEEVDRAMKKVQRRRRWLEWEKRVLDAQEGVKEETAAAAEKRFARRFAALEEHEKELGGLVTEKNYESAVKLFRAAIVYNRYRPFRVTSYLSLLGAAARRGDVETAIQVWGHHEGVKNSDERKHEGAADDRPLVRMFSLLLQAYANAREASGIKEVLQEFLEQERNGALADGRGAGKDELAVMRSVNGLFSEVLHAYILSGQTDVAFGLLDEMAQVSPEEAVKPGSLPSLSLQAIARSVYSLATSGDFDRALQLVNDIQRKYASSLDDRERKVATRQCAQYIVNEAISTSNVDVLRRAVELLPVGVEEHSTDAGDAFATTIQRALLLVANEQPYPVDTILHLLRVSDAPNIRAECSVSPRSGVPRLLRACFERETLRDALYVLEFFDKEHHTGIGALSHDLFVRRSDLVALAADFEEALAITSMLARYGCYPSTADSMQLVRQYRTAANRSSTWTPARASSLIKVFEGPAGAVEAEALHGEDAREYDLALDQLVKDLAAATSAGLKVDTLDLGRLMNIVSLRKGDEQAQSVMREAFGQEAVAPLLQPSSPHVSSEAGTEPFAPSETSTAPTSVAPTYRIDKRLSYTVDSHFGAKASMTPLASYAALKQALSQGIAAEPFVIGRLLQALARMGEESKVRELYALAHEVIATALPEQRQLAAWIQVEDFMLIAACHLGHLEQAGMHRARIIEQGMAPSADAYATMISSTKDTTDDASVARELWEESQRCGVKPHLYLYNTIISKLSKARKAEQAIEFFRNMKAEGLKPSSVTYGAVINACVRVGDVESATTLFEEMQNMPNFKPRVPPYNTMMQMHLQTQPSRELVLHYYNQMIQANVSPSAHTYKLLLDAYGTLQPIDLDAMQKIFDNLCKDRRVDVQGTHWASLIHAHGNVAGQPEKAIEIFESIPSHPSTLSKDIEPVCWEAILNVLASAKMADRMEEYVARMQQQHVRRTAYVNNMLIRGYAAVGKLDKSREIFESMQDAVMGVAAPNNHPALLTSSGQSKPLTTAHTDVVFREPSTYEAMIRAELDAGNRTAASALCDRLESRMYPVAVTSRIRSLIDDPSSPAAGLRS